MEQTITVDSSISLYQELGDAEELISQFSNFLNKYMNLIQSETIDFKNYDIRYFLSLYITDKSLSKNLRGHRKYHTPETISVAYNIVNKIHRKLRFHTKEEIYHEILIPFLHCAQDYKEIGVGFDKYLYKSYKYELKRHLDEMEWDVLDFNGNTGMEIAIEDEWESSIEEEFFLEMDENFELSDPRWVHGNKSEAPFSDLKPHERYILVKYYYEKNTDKEIARMLPYNPKSIHRIRARLLTKLEDLYDKGELRCLRLLTNSTSQLLL